MIAIVVAAVIALAAVMGGVGILLAKRVVNATPHPKLLSVEFAGSEVSLPTDDKTVAAGEYLLRLSGAEAAVVRVGRVLRVVDGKVHRELVSDAGERSGQADGYWSAHSYAFPNEVGEFRTVKVPLEDGEHRDAWLFPGNPAHWVVHVQGIRTSRDVTLRTVAAACEAGATSLTITYRGAGDGPPAKVAMLGAREWTELRDAIAYARASGAQRVTVVAWSMGAALTLELLRRDPTLVDDLVLMCPVSSWPATIEYGAIQAGLPRQAAGLAALIMRSRLGSMLLGMPGKLDIRNLDWTASGALPVRTLIIHSRGDEVVPWSTTTQLAENNRQTATLIETTSCPHGFELTVPDPEVHMKLADWLISQTQP